MFELPKHGQILLKIVGVERVFVDLAPLEEAIKLESPHPKQLAGLIVRERPRAVAFNGERFERLSAWIGVSGDIVRKVDRDLHEFRMNDLARTCKPFQKGGLEPPRTACRAASRPRFASIFRGRL